MSTLEQLKQAVADLHARFPRPGLQLEFSQPYDLQNFSVSYPNVSSAGIYAFLSENLDVLYIGKTSCRSTLGDRLGQHFRWDRTLEVGRPVNPQFAATRFIVTMPVPMDREFEAPSIEEYLLGRIETRFNRIGVPPDNSLDRTREE